MCKPHSGLKCFHCEGHEGWGDIISQNRTRIRLSHSRIWIELEKSGKVVNMNMRNFDQKTKYIQGSSSPSRNIRKRKLKQTINFKIKSRLIQQCRIYEKLQKENKLAEQNHWKGCYRYRSCNETIESEQQQQQQKKTCRIRIFHIDRNNQTGWFLQWKKCKHLVCFKQTKLQTLRQILCINAYVDLKAWGMSCYIYLCTVRFYVVFPLRAR